MALPHYVSETQTLRKVAFDPRCRWIWTFHAPEQMQKRGIHAEDIKWALMNGQVVLHEIKKDILWRVRGTDLDGAIIQVIVAVFEQTIAIKVVTTF